MKIEMKIKYVGGYKKKRKRKRKRKREIIKRREKINEGYRVG